MTCLRDRLACGLSALAVLAACSSKVPASNPYDPTTPPSQQARGVLTGLIDPAVLPSGGETVELYGALGSSLTATADTSGHFKFSDLVPDVYYLQMRAAGFQPLTRPALAIKPGLTLDLGTLSPVALSASDGSITGRVAFEGGTVLPGGTVRIQLQQGAALVDFALAQVGSDGSFAAQVKPGTFTLTAAHPLFVSKTISNIAVTAGQTVAVAALPLALNAATLSGSVLVERVPTSGNPSSTAPVANANVVLDTGAATVTDGSGNFQLPHLLAGQHGFSVQLAGYHDASAPRTVTLSPGVATTLAAPIVLALDRGDLVGQVTTGDGRPVAGATVGIAGGTLAVPVEPAQVGAAQGTFRFSGLPVGSYQLLVTEPGYFPATVGPINVTAGALAQASAVTLAPGQGSFGIVSNNAQSQPGTTSTAAVTLRLAFAGAVSVRASEDATFQAGAQPWSNYGSSLPFMLGAGDGTHVVYVQTQDGNGTRSAVYSARVVLDTVAPSLPVVLLDGGAAYTSQAPGIQLTLSANEQPAAGVDATSGLSLVRISRDGVLDSSGNLKNFSTAPYQHDLLYLLPASDQADGAKTFWVQFMDGAGNLSDPTALSSRASIVLDRAPPSGLAISIDDGASAAQPGYTNIGLVNLRLAATDTSGSAVSMRVANSASALASALYQPLLAQQAWPLDTSSGSGTKTVYAQFQDQAGNATGVISAPIGYDAAPPSVSASIAGLTAASATRSTALSLNVTASDAESGLAATSLQISESATFSGATWMAFSATPGYTLQNTSDGPHLIYVRARDKAGNAAAVALGFTLDRTPPTAALTVGDGSGLSQTQSIALTFAAASPDTAQMAVVLDPSSPVTCSSATPGWAPFLASSNVNFTSDGAHSLSVCLMDAVGNVQPVPLTGQVLIDTQTPAGALSSISGTLGDGVTASTTRTSTTSVTLNVSATSAVAADPVFQMQISNSGNFLSVPWVRYQASVPWQLASGDGSKTVSVRFRTQTFQVSASSSASILLDGTPPSWTSAPSAASPWVGTSRQVQLSFAATDNLDTPANLRVALVEAANGSSPATPASGLCASLSPGAYLPYTGGTQTFTFPNADADGSYSLFACAKDQAGNVALAPPPYPQLTLDTAQPLPPVFNGLIALGGGAQVSWTDPNSDTDHLELDVSQDPSFASGVSTVITPSNNATSFNLTGLTNFVPSFVRGRVVERSGQKSANAAAPGAVIAGLGKASFQGIPSGALSLTASGKTLYAHYPVPGAEVVMICAAGQHDCRNTANWQQGNVPVAVNSVNAQGALEPGALFTDENYLWLATAGVNSATGNGEVHARYCALGSNCTIASNWTDVTLRSSANNLSRIAAGVTASALVLIYSNGTATSGVAAITRCDRSDANLCTQSGSWTSADLAITLDDSQPGFRPVAIGTESGFYAGVRAGACFDNGGSSPPRVIPGQNVYLRCGNACKNFTGCNYYGCGDLTYSPLSNAGVSGNCAANPSASLDELPAALGETGGAILASWISRSAGQDTVSARLCTSSAGCFNSAYFAGASTVFAARPGGTQRPNLSVVATGNGRGPGSLMRLFYPDANPGAPQLWSATCNVGDSSCYGTFKTTSLASGAEATAPIASARLGQNFFLASTSALGNAQIYLPLVPVPLQTLGVPQAGGIGVGWLSEQDGIGMNIFSGPALGPPWAGSPWANSLTTSNPYTSSVSLTATGATYSAVQGLSTSGLGDVSQPWLAKPFAAVSSPASVNTSMPLSLASTVAGSSGNGGAPVDSPYVYSVTDLAAGGGLQLGRCPQGQDCSGGSAWTPALIGPGGWDTLQLSVDYPRNWIDATPIANSSPRLLAAGRSGGAMKVMMCDVAADPTNQCVGAAAWAGPASLGSTSGAKTTQARLTGDFAMTTEDQSGSAVARFCDGGPSFRSACDPYCAQPANAGLCVERSPSYCASATNWKNGPALAGGNGNVAGAPHPTYGWVLAQGAASSGLNVWSCPYSAFAGGCSSLTPKDCTQLANWTKVSIPTGGSVSALDVFSTRQNYFPIVGVNDDSRAELVSFFDGAWKLAICRGPTDPQFFGAWACTSSSGWSTATIAPSLGTPLSSTIRVVNGDLQVLLVEDGRVALASCAGGADCSRSASWRVLTVSTGFTIDNWSAAPAGQGLFTGDENGLLYLGYPSVSGTNRQANLFAQGQFLAPH